MIKYYTSTYSDKVEVKNIEKETAKTVWIKWDNGRVRQERKDTSYGQYHNTWAEAKDWLVEYRQGKVDSLKDSLARAEIHLLAVTALREQANANN